MGPYTPETKVGRVAGMIYHRTADVPREDRKKSARAMRKAARQEGKRMCINSRESALTSPDVH